MTVVERHLVRSATGGTVHLSTCRFAGRPGVSPWIWANVVTPVAIRELVEEMSYRVCRVCRPLKNL